MAVAEAWPRAAADLDPHFERIDIGLHLTLTRLPPLGPMPRLAPEGRLPPLGMLMRLALERRLDRAEVAAELERQFDAFVTATGRLPDFIDGHQHVHILPGVREQAVDLVRRRLDLRRAYVRSCREPLPAILLRRTQTAKAVLLSTLSRRLAALCRREGIADRKSTRLNSSH